MIQNYCSPLEQMFRKGIRIRRWRLNLHKQVLTLPSPAPVCRTTRALSLKIYGKQILPLLMDLGLLIITEVQLPIHTILNLKRVSVV